MNLLDNLFSLQTPDELQGNLTRKRSGIPWPWWLFSFPLVRLACDTQKSPRDFHFPDWPFTERSKLPR